MSNHASPTGARHRKEKKSFSFYKFLHVLGELCITMSVVLALFLVWQVYYTSWQVEDVKKQAVANFHKNAPILKHKIATNLRYDDPPANDPAKHMQIFGALYVPSWKTDPMPIAEGVDLAVLDRGYAGHYPKTAQAGQIGNFSLAGHRLTYGNNFDKLPDLKTGDPVVVETEKAWIIYKVSAHDLVLPTQVDVVAPVPNHPREIPTQRLMTMTTCATSTGGRWGNSHRWITHAAFDHWIDKADGIPAELAEVLN